MVLYKAGKSKEGASTTLAAISHFSIAKGKPDIIQNPVVRKIMKGWARVDKREPIIECRLQLILNSLKKQLSCWHLGGAFRISELVPSSKKNLVKGLMFRHVLIQEDKILVYISRSKMDQLGKGRWVKIGETSGVSCPVRAVQEYILFRQEKRKSVVANGWDLNMFGSHSFRIGAATEAAMKGEKEERIKGIGRWCSKVKISKSFSIAK
ncbi:hypothetical protein XELAEV_18016870mg [Xenopus laevis]|uniref:Tyr recombinase domain-containing protein n=1 Tax=Xenopus laevis TaxID=8355 RepID=A0A974DCU5_XENLA|nr:hypothetical protein XELAEV_18016870mg [Xenopus laevis]